MSAPVGRGRGESSKVDIIDQADVRTAEDRRRATEAASLLGLSEGDVPVRGRGGFRQAELRTIPANIQKIRADNLQNVRQCDILANYVPILTKPNSQLQMYRIDFEPSVESVQLMRYLFRTAARQAFSKVPMYDGVHECRSGQILANKTTSVNVSESNDKDSKSYKVTFTHTGTTAMGSEMIRTYNIHMKEFFRIMGFFQPQPGLHVHPQQSFPVGQDIMILRGFRTAANIHDEGKLLMNFEASHKLLQTHSVCDVMRRIRNETRDGNFQEQIRMQLTGKLVVTSYNKRAYRVEDVDFSSNPRSKFTKRDGSEISYVDYFRAAYNVAINDVQQPLLTVIPSNKRRRGDEERDKEVKLIPELCNIAGLTEAQRNDNRLKMDLIRASQIAPQQRVEQLRSFLETMHSNEEIQQQLSSWGYSYGTDAFKMKAYIIGQTGIGTGALAQQGHDRWQRANPETADFQVKALAVTPNIAKMAIVTSKSEIPNRGRRSESLRGGFDIINLHVNQVEQHDLDSDHAAQFANKMKSISSDTTVTIVIMRNQNKTIYDAIKKAATTERGMVTQCVTSRLMTDPKKARSAATKIAIQVAAKVGGEPWWVDIPLKGSMICGYDTYHDTASRGRSFGAFLASMNDRFSKWFSKADQHDKLDEMSSQVATNMLEALNAYKKINGRYPERVIIYRDGVGEGQLEHVYKTELKGIREKVESVNAKIRMAMVIVNKRIGARFYMRGQDGRFINPPPGTVIDHGVTRSERYDFYLISQSTRQGTISPTYYNIIHDEVGFGPDIHQKLAFKMCLLYYNWSGSVRVPAPCQYAHKLALLCGEHLHSQPNANLNNRLHFL